jgi:predicted transcriptional regulator
MSELTPIERAVLQAVAERPNLSEKTCRAFAALTWDETKLVFKSMCFRGYIGAATNPQSDDYDLTDLGRAALREYKETK